MSLSASSSAPENEMISQMAQRFAALMAAAGSPSGTVTGLSSGTPPPPPPAPPAAGGSVASASPASSGGSGAAPALPLASSGGGGAAASGAAASAAASGPTELEKTWLELDQSMAKLKAIQEADTKALKTSGDELTKALKTSGDELTAANLVIESLKGAAGKNAAHLQAVTAELNSVKAALRTEMDALAQRQADAGDNIHGEVMTICTLLNRVV